MGCISRDQRASSIMQRAGVFGVLFGNEHRVFSMLLRVSVTAGILAMSEEEPICQAC